MATFCQVKDQHGNNLRKRPTKYSTFSERNRYIDAVILAHLALYRIMGWCMFMVKTDPGKKGFCGSGGAAWIILDRVLSK